MGYARGKISLNQKFLILIAVMVVIFTANFLVLNHVTGEIRKNWTDYLKQIAERQKDLMAIKSQLGFGGGIHNFKNYILRRDAKYFEVAHKKISQAIEIVKNYSLIEGRSSREKASLNNLSIVFDKYLLALLKAKSMLEDGKPPNEIDPAVKVEDAPALKAFASLEKVYDELTAKTTQKISASISRSLNTLVASLTFAFFIINVFASQ